MTTSGSFTWNPGIDDILTDAWERCGIEQSDISAQMWDSSIFSLNAVLSELVNTQLNQWEVEPILLDLTEGVRTYQLPDGTVDLLEGYRRSYTRVLGGTPATSAGGTASYAFDGLTSTSCTQVSPNGNISYDYGSGNPQVITMFGYQATASQTLKLVYEGSNDNAVWVTVVETLSRTYPAGIIIWTETVTPGSYQYYRVRETAGGTLNPEEVYFGNNVMDFVLGRVSREEYGSYNNKDNPGIPVSFYVQRAINPYVNIYQNPDGQFTVLKFNRIRQIQTVDGAAQTLDTPFRFIEVVTSKLAVKLAAKKAPDRLQYLIGLAKESLDIADAEDRERVDAQFTPDLSGYRIQ